MTVSLSTSVKYITTGLAAALMSAPAAWAIGGDDPINGIDIIIKKNPGSQPITPGRFGKKEIGLTYDAGAEKLNARLTDLMGRTFKQNDIKDKGWMRYMPITAKSLSEQISEGQEGAGSFTYPSADGRSKMTVTIKIRGGDAAVERKDRSDGGNIDDAFMRRFGTKDTTTAPVMQKMDADTYGSTRSNRGSGNSITAPQPDGTPDLGDVQSRAINDGKAGTRNGIAVMKRTQDFRKPDTEPTQCVTVDGAVDANCDGVADAVPTARQDRRADRKKARQDKK